MSVGRTTPNKKGHGGSVSYERQSSSSIAEESHLHGVSASRASGSNKQKGSGQIDESIHESVPSESGVNSNSSSAILVNRKEAAAA